MTEKPQKWWRVRATETHDVEIEVQAEYLDLAKAQALLDAKDADYYVMEDEIVDREVTEIIGEITP